MDEQNPSQANDYQHGYVSGIEGLDSTVYESYVSSHVSHDWILDRLAEKREDLSTVRHRHQDTTQKYKIAFDKLQESATQVNAQTKQIAELEDESERIGSEIGELREKRSVQSPGYSLIAGLIFLAAGLSFIAGDLIISHEIVAYALNIRNSNEAWAFAIGLAMLSVLLKPAYDRLVEDPYHDPESRKGKTRYMRFKLTLSVFAIVTLVVLGWFRYEAYRTDKLKEAINKSVKGLQLNAVDPLTGAPISSPELTSKIEAALRDSDQLNLELVNSPWALLSFVLSGVLFAVAGAVSLGMALPVLQAFWYRWLQIDPKIWRLKRRRKQIWKQLASIRETLREQSAEKNIRENDLFLLPLFDQLRKEEEEIKAEIASLEQERRQVLSDTRVHSFTDGYAHGKVSRDVMTEEEYESWRNGHLSISNLALKAKSNAATDRAISTTDRVVTRPKSAGIRPHQAIRRAITDRFDENNQ
jgi:cell division protein FtsB